METKNQDQSLVSIIVLTYNLSKYVVETLESIKAQTYQNIELVVSDDGSTDGTIDICNQWIEENKLRFVKSKIITTEKNTGIPANCNRGLFASTGEWIKLVAGDDTLKVSCIEDNINYIQHNPDIFVLFSYMDPYKNTFSKETLVIQPKIPPLDLINSTITAKQQYKLLLIRNRTPGAAFFSRKALVNVGGWDERYKIEDDPMWLKLTKAGYKLYFMEKVTFNYRLHDNSITHLANNCLVNRAYLWGEPYRRDNVYPFLEWKYKLDYLYKYQASLLVSWIFSNKSTRFSRFVYYMMLKWLNPFYYYRSMIRVKNMLLGSTDPITE